MEDQNSEIIDKILSDLKIVWGLPREILEKQERYWIRCSNFPEQQREKVIFAIKNKTGKDARWISSSELEIEFFKEDELSEIRHKIKIDLRKHRPNKRIQRSIN